MKPANTWIDFLSVRIQSQIRKEISDRAHTWALGLLSLVALVFTLSNIKAAPGPADLFASKLLTLVLFQPVVFFAFFLPNILDAKSKPVSRFLGIRDFSEFIFSGISLVFFLYIICTVNFQVGAAAAKFKLPGLTTVFIWTHFALSAGYLISLLTHFAGYFFAPAVSLKLSSLREKLYPILAGLHAVFFLILGLGYNELLPIGSKPFFSHLLVAAPFFIFTLSFLAFRGAVSKESPVASLENLHLDLQRGSLLNEKLIQARIEDAFISNRFADWISQISYQTDTQAQGISALTNQILSTVQHGLPRELDLQLVEDHYKKAAAMLKKCEKAALRFSYSTKYLTTDALALTFIEEITDQFAREIRNARLDLASIRRQIDEHLVTLKNEMKQIAEGPIKELSDLSDRETDDSDELTNAQILEATESRNKELFEAEENEITEKIEQSSSSKNS